MTERKRPAGVTDPLAVRIVGRTAGALALLGVAAFIAVLVVAIAGPQASSGGMAEGFWKDFLLFGLLPIMGGSLVLAILLALLNAVAATGDPAIVVVGVAATGGYAVGGLFQRRRPA